MGLIARDTGEGKDFSPIDAGMHHAVCIGIYDLGTHWNERFNNQAHKVLIMWELPDERIEVEKDGNKLNLPKAISKQYTLSLHEKSNLRKDLETWRGKQFTQKELDGFDLKNLLGVNCMLQIIHREKNDKTYANVASIVPLMKNMAKKKPENNLKFFSFEDGGSLPENTAEWIEKLIMQSNEMTGEGDGGNNNFDPGDERPPLSAYEDDIPF